MGPRLMGVKTGLIGETFTHIPDQGGCLRHIECQATGFCAAKADMFGQMSAHQCRLGIVLADQAARQVDHVVDPGFSKLKLKENRFKSSDGTTPAAEIAVGRQKGTWLTLR
jgi:hypothetical protein